MTKKIHDWKAIRVNEPSWIVSFSKPTQTFTLTNIQTFTHSEVFVSDGKVVRASVFWTDSEQLCDDERFIRDHCNFAQKLLNTGVIDG